MGNNVRIASMEVDRDDNRQLTKGIDRECAAPLSLMTFFDPTAVRTVPPNPEPIDEINRRFHLGETAKLLGWYRMSLARFITTRPPELAEAVFSFGLIEKGQPDIIRLRATDHIRAPDKNIVSTFYLVWQVEVFPDPKDYEGHVLNELVRELYDLAAGGIMQHTLLAMITQINNCQRLFR